MSRKNITISTEAVEFKCDFCNMVCVNPHGYAGGLPSICECEVCKKDVCREHRYEFWDKFTFDDGFEQYNSIITCLQCRPIVEKIWEEENEKDLCAKDDGRLVYAVRKILKREKNED